MLHITEDGVIEVTGRHVQGFHITDWVDGDLAQQIIATLKVNDDGLSGKVKAASIHFGGKSKNLRWYPCTFDMNWGLRMTPSEAAMVYLRDHFHHGDEFTQFLHWVLTGEGSHIYAKAPWKRWTHTTRNGVELLAAECGNIAKIKLMEQNPNKESEWAERARAGATVFQVFLNDRYVGVIVNGAFMFYGQKETTPTVG